MGPIVCSIDDSDAAVHVARVARELAVALGARLVVVHVAPPIQAPGISTAPKGPERLLEAELEDARRVLDDVAAQARLEGADLRAELGPAADRIVELSRDENAALVVVGSRGRGDIASAVLGSVSHSVVSHASCPVVIVPPAASERSLE